MQTVQSNITHKIRDLILFLVQLKCIWCWWYNEAFLRAISWEVFPAFGLNTEKYEQCGKYGQGKLQIRTLFPQCISSKQLFLNRYSLLVASNTYFPLNSDCVFPISDFPTDDHLESTVSQILYVRKEAGTEGVL